MGFEPRDPHLGKVIEFVHGVLASPPTWPPVYGTSARIRPEFNPVVERSTTESPGPSSRAEQ